VQLALLCDAGEQAGNYTRATQWQFTDAGYQVNGVQFFWQIAGRTLKLGVWNQQGYLIHTQNVVTVGGVQSVTFPAPISFAPYQNWYVSFYETSGTVQEFFTVAEIPAPTVNPLSGLSGGYAQSFLADWLLYNQAGLYSAGDAFPTTPETPAQAVAPLEPILVKAPTRPTGNKLIVLGDSQSAPGSTLGGIGFYPGQDWPTQYAAYFASRQVTVINGAVGGYTTQDVIDTMGPYLAQAGPGDVIVVWAGTNDLYRGVPAGIDYSAAGAWARLQTIITAALATGAYLVLGDCLPRTEPGTPVSYATQQPLLNASIAASGRPFAPLAAHFPNSNDLTYYRSDAVHLNAQPGKVLAAFYFSLLINGHV
jgi:lysophospholipase L1-like esterase